MEPHSFFSSKLILTISLIAVFFSQGVLVLGTTFTFVNKCEYTVWPGILANAGTQKLDSTGFELPSDSSRTFIAPTGWSGRFWGRTGCNFDGSGSGSCATADCGSGEEECNGAGAAPPATLAEFTLGTAGGQDFYDVSLVDGYNLAMIVEGSGGSGMCATTGCLTDLNRFCPSELRVGNGEACKSACDAFGSPEYCCSGAFNSPSLCKPSTYSQMFKSVCPRSYSYAYDDPTSTFTCTGADYTLTFCPSSPSQKSTKDTTPTVTTPSTSDTPSTTANGYAPPTPANNYGSIPIPIPGSGILGSESGSDSDSDGSGSESGNFSGSGGSGSEVSLADGSYLAGLALGKSTRHEFSIVVLGGCALFASSTLLFSFMDFL